MAGVSHAAAEGNVKAAVEANMEQAPERTERAPEGAGLRLSDFCSMDEFEQVLDDWSVATHMAVVVWDADGRGISAAHGFSDYCRLLWSSEEGRKACVMSRGQDGGSCLCHAGLCVFSMPVTLPGGKGTVRILGGQVRLPDSPLPDFEGLSAAHGLDAEKLAACHERMPVKTRGELDAARSLLRTSVENFIGRNYEKWLRWHQKSEDRTLSRLTQILYAYNITLDLETGRYSLITGTGLDRTVEVFKRHSVYAEAQAENLASVHPGYRKRMLALTDLESLRASGSRDGHLETLEYPVLYPDRDRYEWHEINIFAGTDARGRTTVNILGRDVTEAHELQERNSRELRAAAARNQILSDLTRMLYSYNLTLNLKTGKFSLIEGTGMTEFMEIFRSTDDYAAAYERKMQLLLPEFAEQFAAIASLEALRGHRDSHGFIGSLAYGAQARHGVEWHEINIFISTNEEGAPCANILGRDITEAHRRQEQKELAQKVATARDQLLSGVTKMLYSFNISVNLSTWKYSLIPGTGCEAAVAAMCDTDDYVLNYNRIRRMLDGESGKALDSLCGVDALEGFRSRSGFIGTITTSADTAHGRRWQEVNLFMGTNEYGEPTANILGRDVTDVRRRQEERENELKASAAKDQILAEITRALYSYNITVDLETGRYTLITGTGMDLMVGFLKTTDDYSEVVRFGAAHVAEAQAEAYLGLIGLENLRAAASRRSGHIGQLEYAVQGPGGTEWHEVNVYLSVDEKGSHRASILGRDISAAHFAQERRENELRAVAAKDQILSGITKVLYSYNLTLNLDTGRYSLILGTGMKDFVAIFEATDDYETAFGRKLQYVSDEYRDSFAAFSSLAALRGMKDRNGYVGTMEYSADPGTGLEWHEINVFIGTNGDGEPIANLLGRDITEAHELQARRERELRAAAARDQLLSSVTKMLYSYNMTVSLTTGKYTVITGTGLDDEVRFMQGHEDYQAVIDRFLGVVDPAHREHARTFLSLDAYRGREQNGFEGTAEFPVRKKGGGVEWNEINVFSGVGDDGGPVINILGRDCTEAHDRADTVAQLEIAKASSRAKSNFLFNMSHDIRTPMNAIIGFTDLLQKHLDDRRLAEDYIGKIRHSNEFLLSLINNVLEMARIESGKETLDETEQDAVRLDESIGTVFSAQMREKGLRFSHAIHVEHPRILCDATKIREIFLNLLSNALKYTPKGGSVTLETVELPSGREGTVLYRTVVADTGIGMSREFLPHVFEEFARERNTTESRIMGTGLGMSIVRNLVALMGGTVGVESEPGRGTRFTVEIPHRIAARADAGEAPAAAPALEHAGLSGRRVLLAEDNELNAEIAASLLEDEGIEVEHAWDGVQCVAMMEQAPAGRYDLVLMDIQMPNLDGYGAARRIRALPDAKKAGVPIVAMTANAFDEDRRNAFAAGMDAHLAKPVDPGRLKSVLADMIGRK